MTRLSVNINKIATIRNARGGDTPNVLQIALDCERFGAQGITVHPRPDQRHIRFSDVDILSHNLRTEFNIEGYPSDDFISMVLAAKPTQVTLVPDPPDILTSNAGWNTRTNQDMLTEIVGVFKDAHIRTSLFMGTQIDLISHAQTTGTDRIELYTESYAKAYTENKEQAIHPFRVAAKAVADLGMGLNAGHDLNLQNLRYFATHIPNLDEVSIGHALISDALYYGLENTIALYGRELKSI